jgi:hypothetical protein
MANSKILLSIPVFAALVARFNTPTSITPNPDPSANETALYRAVYKELDLTGKSVIRAETDDCSALSTGALPAEVPVHLWRRMLNANSNSKPVPVRIPGFTYETSRFIEDHQAFSKRYPDNFLGETVSLSLPGYDFTHSRALVLVSCYHSRGAAGFLVEMRRNQESWKTVRKTIAFWIT